MGVDPTGTLGLFGDGRSGLLIMRLQRLRIGEGVYNLSLPTPPVSMLSNLLAL